VAVDRSLIGKSTGTMRVVVERGPVQIFAEAVKDDDPVYRDPRAAGAAGLPAIPAPPTFPIAMEHWGRFVEQQPAEDGEAFSPFGAIIGPLLAKGGLILHGEQEYAYARPIFVGDVLVGTGQLVDVYEKASGGRTMTFVVVETTWSDERTGDPVVTARLNLIHRA
jgi:acyl dehydratase